MALALALVVAVAAPGRAEIDLAPVRVAGATRVETAAALARAAFPGGAAEAVVAAAEGPADALAASGLAGALRGPVLLVTQSAVPEATRAALGELGVARVHLLGGEAVVPASVAEALAATVEVVRLAGGGREATSALVAARIAELTGAQPTRALLAGSAAASDALAASGLAWAQSLPVLLTGPEALHPAAAEVLDGVAEVLVVGGEAAVPAAVVAEVEAGGATVRRVAGATRAGTAVAIADHAGAGPRVLLVAAGDPVDALAAAPLAGGATDTAASPAARAGESGPQEAAPPHPATVAPPAGLVVGESGPQEAASPHPVAGVTRAAGEGIAAVLPVGADGSVPPEVAAWLAARCGSGVVAQALGGEAAVPAAAVDAVLRAARDCDPAPGMTVRFATAVDPATGADPAAFAAEVSTILADPRGWPAPGRLAFAGVAEAHDLGIVLAGDGLLQAVGPACLAAGGCRAGRNLYVASSPPGAPPPGVDDATRRARAVNHLVGLWMGEVAGGCEAGVLGPPTCDPFVAWPDAAQRLRVLTRYAPQARLAFGGDVHGEGRVANLLVAGGNPLAHVADFLGAADLAILNLETPISTRGTPADKTFVFRAPPSLAPALAAAGVDIVSLANNHGLDYGVDALLDTFTHLEAAGVRWVGAGRNAAEAYAPVVVDTPAGSIAVVGLSRVFHTQAWAAGPDRPGLASAYDEAAAVAAVQAAAAQADHVVVAIHWGIERADCPDSAQRHLARLLTDAGADVIAGHHPHVLQGVQTGDGGALVAYSLGNFVWYHSRAPSLFTGVLDVTLPGAAWTLHPAEIAADGSPTLVVGSAAEAIHDRVTSRSPGGAAGCAFS